MSDARRSIPSVERLLSSREFADLLAREPRDRIVQLLRTIQMEQRNAQNGASHDVTWYAEELRQRIDAANQLSLRGVINASGVILHTNLGRAPLSSAAIDAMVSAALGYTNLEYDLERGERGSRYTHCADLLCQLTGAEAALVVNNNAAALVLALNTLASNAAVIISRGELVEIGDSFRIAEIVERSGARVLEVGATNRTHPQDYERAAKNAAAILKVHRSNYQMSGFVSDVDAATLAAIARNASLPLIHDLGSGLIEDLRDLGLPHEVTAREALQAADVVTMSGDKLLGGPQAGIIVGRADLIGAMKRNPLCRALRVDKLTLSALEATLQSYVRGRAREEIPVLRMIAMPEEEVRARAQRFAAALKERGIAADVVEGRSTIGGGSYPGVELSTSLVMVGGSEEKLRHGDPPVVVRTIDDRIAIDLRTVFPGQEDELLSRIS